MALTTSKVEFGRRKGSSKDKDKPVDGGVSAAPRLFNGQQIPDGAKLRDVMILSGKDWDRINNQLYRKEIEVEQLRKAREEKEAIRDASKDMSKDWPNTLEGNRRRKLGARAAREDKKEEERRLLDLEEARYQAAKRKEAIEKAKTQQYYQTDKVKNFHSALTLVEVLKERDAQLEFKQLKAAAAQGQDNEFLLQSQKDMEKTILQDQDKAKERIFHAHQTAKFQKAQVHQHLKGKLGEMQVDRREGEELKKLAMLYEDEQRQLDALRFSEKIQLAEDNKRQIVDRQNLFEVERQQLSEEDEECRIFAAAKRKMAKLRFEKERELHLEKQTRLDKIREKLHAQVKAKEDNEDTIISQAVQEAEDKRQKEAEAKESHRKKMYQEAAEHRLSEMKKHERLAAEERIVELEKMKVQQEADEVFRRNEEEKVIRRRVQNETFAKVNLEWADGHRQKEIVEREKMLAQDRKNVELLAVEEDQFQEYAGRVIEHCEKGGRNIYPLRKAAQIGIGGGSGPVYNQKGGIRPSYMAKDTKGNQLPTWQNDATEETKLNTNGDVSTNKRMGFIW